MSTKKERLLSKLNPSLLKMTPKLSGDTGSFIDLDSKDSLEDGAKKLMMRFLKNQDICGQNKRSFGQNEEEVTISSAKYNENEEICELITERLRLPFVKNEETDTSDRPGKRLQMLKMELQEKISQKWEEEYKKRISENKKIEINRKQRKKKTRANSGSDSETSNEKDIGEKEDYEENCSDKDNEANIESDGQDENQSDGMIAHGDQQNDKSNDCESIKEIVLEKDDEYDDNEACSLVPAYQPGGGLLYGGSELTQNDEGLPQNLLSPSLRLSMNESPKSKLSESFNEKTPNKKDYISNEDDDSLLIGKKKLFSQNTSNSFDLNDAFEFCSGKFPDADNVGSQNLMEGNADASDYEADVEDRDEFEEEDKEDEEELEEEDKEDEEELEEEDKEDEEELEEKDKEDEDEFEEKEEEDSNVEVQNPTEELLKNGQKIRKNIIAFEDSEEEEEMEKETEDKQVDEVEETHLKADELLSEDEDSKLNKKTRKSLHFSDEEDEASDREDGDDESEEVNDEADEEADSDSEKADDEEEDCDVRSVQYDSEENEIINPKEFFEKEAELSGSEWSGDEDERGLDEFDAEEGDADNLDSNEVRSQLEKIHIRRVLDDDAKEVRLIQEILFEDGDLHSDGKRRDRKFKWKNLGTFEDQGNEEEAKEEGESSDDCAEEEKQRKLRYEKELFLMGKKKGDISSDEEITGDFKMVKVTRVKAVSSSNTGPDQSKTVMNYTEIAKNTLVSKRGSFLARNEEFLSRLAKATAGVTNNLSGPKNSRNFVFATKSPDKSNSEKNTTCKRQVEDAENCGRVEKRMKILPPEVDTGPSIFDLLV